jgi:hypothetical protein
MNEYIEIRVLPDPEQQALLTATLERVNRVSNQARASALGQNVFSGTDLKDIVRAEIDKQKLPNGFFAPIVDRVEASLQRRAGKQPKFSQYQSLTLPASAVKWSSDGRVTLPTSKGRKSLRVRVDNTRAGLRPPLEGRPVRIVFRNGNFDLVSADVDPPDEDDDD